MAEKVEHEKKVLESERQAFQRENLLLETEKQQSAEKLSPEFVPFELG
ncbi:hypothetical protein [Bacillus cereus]|nr:hypothetical protein [Bacillus cereus]